MGNKTLGLGPLEMEILGRFQGSEFLSVADLQAKLKKAGNDLAYTTVMTILSRLYQKGHLTRKKEGRQFLYQTTPSAVSMPAKIFSQVKDSLFRSYKLNPILSLLESDKTITTDELKELKKVIDARLKSEKSK